VQYLTGEDILAIHERLLEETGGLSGIRDIGLLYSIAEKPKTSFDGQEMYPGIFLKAAVYLEALANYHIFLDGNKRTAFITATVFMAMHGYLLEINEAGGLRFMLAVVNKKKTIHQIAFWLEKHSTTN